MVRAGVCFVFLASLRVASAQPAEPPPPPPPSDQPPEQTSPTAPPSAYERCRELRRHIGSQAEATSDLKERARLLQSMPECRTDMVDVPAPSAPAVMAPEVATTDEFAATGFALEVRLDSAPVLVDSNSALPATQAGIFMGVRSRAVTVGIGLDVGRFTQSIDDPVMGTSSASSNLVLVMPGLRATLARSHDSRTELFGEIDIGYGRNWTTDDDDTDDSPSTGHIRIQVAPGVRYWIASSFSVGAATGIRHERFSLEDTTTMTSRSLAMTTLFGALQLTGVF